jgi:hypothetical protein
MTSFKQKPEKIKYLTNINTLDEVHRKQVETFESKKRNLPKKKAFLTSFEAELNTLILKSRADVNANDIKRISFLKERIEELKEEIREITNDSSEMDYYSRTHEILIEYYNQLEDSNDLSPIPDTPDDSSLSDQKSEQNLSLTSEIPLVTESSINTENADKDKTRDKLILLNEISQKRRKIKKETKKRVKKLNNIVKKKSILSFFSDKKPDEKTSTVAQDTASAVETETEMMTTSSSSEGGIVEQIVTNRASLYETYMGLINKSNSSVNKTRMIRMCNNCSTEKTLIQSEGIYVCKKCGEVEHIIIESEVPNHKDTVNEKPRYPYKRVNHLLELIKNFLIKFC